MSSAAQVIIVGSYVQDQAWFVDRFPKVGETKHAQRYNTGPGGKGFNQATACVRQGVATAFVGAIGNDTFGAIAQQFARDENLPCRWQQRDDQPTATASITVNANAENQIAITFGANEHLDPDFVRTQDDLFANARILLMQLENNLDAVDAAIAMGERYKLIRVLNPAPVNPELDAHALRRVDIITPNETEFALLLERFCDEIVDPLTLADCDDARLHALARKLATDTVVITLGARGCFVSHADLAHARGDDAVCYRVAAEKVSAIDSTGAGDAFSGALVAALVRFSGQSFHAAIVHANRVAAMATEIVGTAPAMPVYQAVIARFGNFA